MGFDSAKSYLKDMAIRVVKFSNEVYKIKKIKNNFLNFENWTNREPQ